MKLATNLHAVTTKDSTLLTLQLHHIIIANSVHTFGIFLLAIQRLLLCKHLIHDQSRYIIGLVQIGVYCV